VDLRSIHGFVRLNCVCSYLHRLRTVSSIESTEMASSAVFGGHPLRIHELTSFFACEIHESISSSDTCFQRFVPSTNSPLETFFGTPYRPQIACVRRTASLRCAVCCSATLYLTRHHSFSIG